MTIFTDKVKKYSPRLQKDLQLTEIQSCGIFGNLGGETGGFTQLQELAPTVKGSKGGYGWMQWTGPRRRKYEAWCKVKGLDKSSDEANYKYLVEESQTDEAASIVGLRKTTTLQAATETFMLLNLRPGKPNLAGRVSWAKKAQDALHASSGVGTAGTVVVAAAAAAAMSPTQHAMLILGIGAAIALVGFLVVRWYKMRVQAVQVMPAATVQEQKESSNVSNPKG